MQFFEALLSQINTRFLSPAACLVLLFAGVFLSVKLRFFQFSNPVKLWRVMNKKMQGGTSPFKALTLALAGTLGVGNISGVAIAISIGGAGAVFWMWISAFLAMIVKYSEIVLAVHHRDVVSGEIHGGAMYYIKKGIKKKGTASVLACCFALFCIFSSLSTGSIIQVNSVSEAMFFTFRISPIYIGVFMALLTALAVFKPESDKISSITVKLVPIMSGIFIFLSLCIIFGNIQHIPDVVKLILNNAFTPDSAFGGLGGFVFSRSIRFGVTKGLFSNEAGCGTSTIAHASANSASPSSQGVWGIFEVFFDTIILCTMTAFVLLLSYGSNVPNDGGGIGVALDAYGFFIGKYAEYIMCAAIFLFAYATIICWAFYGCECIRFLGNSKAVKNIYLTFYILSIIYGAIAPSSFIWEIADLSICTIMIVNTLCVCAMSDTVKELSPIRKEKTQPLSSQKAPRST